MNLTIKTTHISLTPAIADYLEKKLATLKRIVDIDGDNVLVQCELGKTTNHHRSGDIFRAEVNLHINGKFLRAVAKRDDLYAAIDEVKDEIAREMTTMKEKRKSLLRKGAHKIKKLLRFGKSDI